MKNRLAIIALAVGPLALTTHPIQAADTTVPVTVDNFGRAETDFYMSVINKRIGLGKFFHNRNFPPVEDKNVRPNRDTYYSEAIFDLDAGPVTVTLPDAGKRFMSFIVINEDHYVPVVYYGQGSYTLTKENVGTRYVFTAVRTLVNPKFQNDVQTVHALQDAMTINQPHGPGTFEVPAWDPASQKKVRDALKTLGETLPDFRHAFGQKGEVDPIHHVIGTASAWGGNPDRDALYLNTTPEKNDETTTYQLTVPKDVPVDGFWSVTVYDAEGFFRKNEYDAYSLNSITAERQTDGSARIQFGGCDGKISNCLPTMAGWNYTVRLYRPHKSVLDGSWTFPKARPVN